MSAQQAGRVSRRGPCGLHAFLGRNPFGWSGRRIGDLYCGLVKDGYARWKHLRRTPHDHDPVNDARANAEVVLQTIDMGLKLPAR